MTLSELVPLLVKAGLAEAKAEPLARKIQAVLTRSETTNELATNDFVSVEFRKFESWFALMLVFQTAAFLVINTILLSKSVLY